MLLLVFLTVAKSELEEERNHFTRTDNTFSQQTFSFADSLQLLQSEISSLCSEIKTFSNFLHNVLSHTPTENAGRILFSIAMPPNFTFAYKPYLLANHPYLPHFRDGSTFYTSPSMRLFTGSPPISYNKPHVSSNKPFYFTHLNPHSMNRLDGVFNSDITVSTFRPPFSGYNMSIRHNGILSDIAKAVLNPCIGVITARPAQIAGAYAENSRMFHESDCPFFHHQYPFSRQIKSGFRSIPYYTQPLKISRRADSITIPENR